MRDFFLKNFSAKKRMKRQANIRNGHQPKESGKIGEALNC
jgi:hypothetical protein